ncbi:MAG: esterase/lipase family protein [Phormidesmis sp.]
MQRNPVVLVHGIWNTAGIFSALRAHLEREGWVVYALSMTPNNGDAPLEQLAQQVKAFVDECVGPQQPFDLIGFSMGGLVSRYYAQRLGGLAQVNRFITVSAPHNGTILGWFSHRYGVRQMRPGSPFISDLNQDIEQLKSVKFFSLWTPFDLLILPPKSSVVDERIGCTCRLKVPAHNRMIQDQQALERIVTCLCE